jgi:hypothetical protein
MTANQAFAFIGYQSLLLTAMAFDSTAGFPWSA